MGGMLREPRRSGASVPAHHIPNDPERSEPLPPQSIDIFGPKVSTTSHCEVDAHPRFEK